MPSDTISAKACETISTKVNVKQCSLCQGDTEYHCRTCGQNLCPTCKNKHNLRLDTKRKHHNPILYRAKFKSFFKIERCATHPDQVYEWYCETCDLPVCLHCNEHKQHKLQNIGTIYDDKRKKNEESVFNIRNDILYPTQALHAAVKKDITNLKKGIFFS